MNDEKVVVLKYNPAARRRSWALGTSTVLVCLLASYLFGQSNAVDGYSELLEDHHEMETRLSTAQDELSSLRQQVVNLERGAAIDKAALEQMRLETGEARRSNAALAEEITFYRDLLDPGSRPAGLEIRQFSLQPAGEDLRYGFRLVLMQVSKKHALISGTVSVSIKGVDEAGTQRRYHIHEISDDVDTEQLKLRFRYFQSIEGALQLPVGFHPEEVAVQAKAGGKAAEASFEWATVRG